MNSGVMNILQDAAAQFQRGRFLEALASSEAALKHAPNHPEALHLKALALGRLQRIEEALPFFDAAAARHPQRHAILANKGNALRAVERIDEAIEAYTASVAANPNFANGWAGLGGACRQTGEIDKAEDAFRRALVAEPNDAGTLNNLGLLLTDANRREEAVAAFSSALAARPDMVFALVNRGAALRSIGRIDEALADHRRAAALAPEDPETQYQLANTLRQAGLMAEAESAYQAALRAAPARVNIHRDYARLLWEMGESGRFLEPLEQAIAAEPHAYLLTLKGELAMRAGQLAVAEQAATQAIAVDARCSVGHRIIGRVRRHESNVDAATTSLEASFRLAPDDFETLHELAETLLVGGDVERALDLLRTEPPREHLQKHIALKTIAMRLSGDEEYRRLYDYDRFTRKIMIEPPAGFANLAAFNDALAAAIVPLHATRQQPLDQTLYGGTQSFGRLWDEPNPVIQALKRQLLETARTYVAGLPDDPDHPFLAQKSMALDCAGAWSVVLSSGGGHVDHIHPEGWISASYYVRIPQEVAGLNQDGGDKAGFLRLGASGVDGVKLPAERWVKPEEGAVVFFPSYIWHGVENFASQSPRITAPFDLAPAPPAR